MSERNVIPNYKKQGGVRMVASWLVVLILFVKMIYMSYKNGMSGMTYYAFAVSIFILLYSVLGMAVVPVLRRLVYFQVNKGSYKNAEKIYRVVLFFSMVLAALFSTAMFIFSQQLSSLLFGTVLCSLLFKILAIALIFCVPAFCIRGYLEGLGNYMPGVFSDVIAQLVSLVVTCLTQSAFSDYGKKVALLVRVDTYAYAYSVCGGAAGIVVGALVGFLFLILILGVLKKDIKSGIWGDEIRSTDSVTDILWNYIGCYFSEMFEKQMGIFLSVILIVLYCNSTGRTVNGAGMIYMGVFWLLVPLLMMAEQMGMPFSRQLTAIMKRLDYHHARERFSVYLKVLSYCVFFYVFFVFCIAKPVGTAFFDVENPEFSGIIRSGMVVGGVMAFSVFLRYVSAAVIKNFLRNLFALGSLLSGILFYFVINKSGTGAEESYIYAILLAWMLYLLMQCMVLFKKLRIFDQLLRSILLPFVAALFTGVIVWGISFLLSDLLNAWVLVFILAVAGYFIYNMVIVLLGVFESHEWMEVPFRKFPVFFKKVCNR